MAPSLGLTHGTCGIRGYQPADSAGLPQANGKVERSPFGQPKSVYPPPPPPRADLPDPLPSAPQSSALGARIQPSPSPLALRYDPSRAPVELRDRTRMIPHLACNHA